jgi:hypothetical protein
MAVALTGDLLPPSVQAWLAAELHYNKTGSWTFPRVEKPGPEVLPAVSAALKSLSEILQPARERGNELEKVIAPMFAVMNVYTGDQAKLTLQVAEWCHYLEDYPLYAIRKAAKWTVLSNDKLPSVAAFIADVKRAVGAGVIERQQLLLRAGNFGPN